MNNKTRKGSNVSIAFSIDFWDQFLVLGVCGRTGSRRWHLETGPIPIPSVKASWSESRRGHRGISREWCSVGQACGVLIWERTFPALLMGGW